MNDVRLLINGSSEDLELVAVLENGDDENSTGNVSIQDCPASWTCSLDVLNFTLAPNMTANFTLSVTVLSTATAGSNVIKLVADDGVAPHTYSFTVDVSVPVVETNDTNETVVNETNNEEGKAAKLLLLLSFQL